MVRYQYAKNEHGEIVKAVDLVGIEDKAKYICIGCDNPLIAKVNGKINKQLSYIMQRLICKTSLRKFRIIVAMHLK